MEWLGVVGSQWPSTLPIWVAALVAMVALPLGLSWLVAMASLLPLLLRLLGGEDRWGPLGLAYLGLSLAALGWLAQSVDAPGWWLLWLFMTVWGADIGGYAFGKTIGGPKLAPRISPKKTWSGALGGLALSGGAGILVSQALQNTEHAWLLIVASLAFSAISQLGDLLESLVKRRFGKKDSGAIIPGHGGLLDRLDGLLLAAPAMACFAWWMQGQPIMFVFRDSLWP
jgi:phosphatidate cytidylyltransferase